MDTTVWGESSDRPGSNVGRRGVVPLEEHPVHRRRPGHTVRSAETVVDDLHVDCARYLQVDDRVVSVLDDASVDAFAGEVGGAALPAGVLHPTVDQLPSPVLAVALRMVQ